MGLKEFFTIKMGYFRRYPQYFYPACPVGPADRTGVKLFSILPGPTLQHSILPL